MIKRGGKHEKTGGGRERNRKKREEKKGIKLMERCMRRGRKYEEWGTNAWKGMEEEGAIKSKESKGN